MSWTTNCATSPIALTLRPAGGEHAARVGPWGGPAQDSGNLAVAPDERNFHAPGRDHAAAIIVDAPHPRAECALHPKRDAGAAREHDDILPRRALDRAGERNVGYLFNLHVEASWPVVVQRNADFGPYTRAGDDGSEIEFMTVKRKITSRHGVDSRPLSE